MSNEVPGLTVLEQLLALGQWQSLVVCLYVALQAPFRDYCSAGSAVEQAVVGMVLDRAHE